MSTLGTARPDGDALVSWWAQGGEGVWVYVGEPYCWFSWLGEEVTEAKCWINLLIQERWDGGRKVRWSPIGSVYLRVWWRMRSVSKRIETFYGNDFRGLWWLTKSHSSLALVLPAAVGRITFLKVMCSRLRKALHVHGTSVEAYGMWRKCSCRSSSVAMRQSRAQRKFLERNGIRQLVWW